MSEGFSFGDAIAALKAGKRVSRAGWNGKGMFLVLQFGSVVQPEQAKPGSAVYYAAQETGSPVCILPHIDMKAADGSVVIGWLASQTDMLAEDWSVVE